MLCKTLARFHLVYANCVWSPFRQMHVEKVEMLQMRTTRMVEQLNIYSYDDRLRGLIMPTLKYINFRGDIIQVYSIIFGMHDLINLFI